MTATAEDDARDMHDDPPGAPGARAQEALAALDDALTDDASATGLLARVCCAVVQGAGIAAASIACPRPDGTVELAGAHPDGLDQLAREQFVLREGPCYDSWSTAAPVAVEDGRDGAAARWPRWGRLAADRWPPGADALRSQPVAAGFAGNGAGARAVIGTMGTPAAVRAADSPVVNQMVRIGVTHALTVDSHGHHKALAGQLRHALDSRVRIEQAKGALARHYGIGVEEAFERLRRLARDQSRRLHEVAGEVVDQLARRHPLPEETAVDGIPGAAPALRIVRRPGGLRLLGAADLSAVPILTSALEHAPGDRELVVDLERLEFLDAQCAGVLLRAAEGRPQRELVLHGARPVVAQVLTLLGAHEQPGVRVVTSAGGGAHST